MSFTDLVRMNRSYRRFDQSLRVEPGTLRELIGLARICPSAMNAQPLRYIYSCDPQMNDRIFPTLSWAGSLKEWDGPVPGEQPAGYIVVLAQGATHAYTGHDVGIACQTMLLAAAERGLGGCMLGSVQREELAQILDLPDGHTILLVVALGTPAEAVVLEEAAAGEPVTYYRESDGSHHVPKRKLEEVILNGYQ